MQSFGDMIWGILQRYQLGRFQGSDTRNTRELLADLEQSDPERWPVIRREIVAEVIRGLNASQDSARQAHIDQTNNLDNVSWLHGINPSIPTVERTFAKFIVRPDWPDVQKAYVAVNAWVRGVGPGLLTLTGPTGCGKSHLAIAAAQVLFAHDKPVIYREEAALIQELQQHIRDNTVEQALQEFMEVPWLIIDDLGLAALGDWAKERMDRLLNRRWESVEWCRTLITTNLISDELPVRIASRLGDVTKASAIAIQASDYRRA